MHTMLFNVLEGIWKMRKPRITAASEIEAAELRADDRVVAISPGVSLTVTFDLGDRAEAMARLDTVIQEVLEQIEVAHR